MRAPSPRTLTTAAITVFGGEIGFAAYVWRLGPPGPIPMHFGISGAVDRYGDRSELAGVICGSAVIGALCWVVLEAMRRRSSNPSGLAWSQTVLLIVFALLSLVHLSLLVGLGDSLNMSGATTRMGALSLIFVGIGAFLGKSSPNPFVGVRTYWSLNSRLAWEKSNRLAGCLMFWCGLAGLLATPIAPQPLAFQALIGAIIVAAVASVFESWRVWRIDPDRARF